MTRQLEGKLGGVHQGVKIRRGRKKSLCVRERPAKLIMNDSREGRAEG